MTNKILALLGGAGLFQGLFLTIFVLSTPLRNRFSNMLLSGLNLLLVIFLANTIVHFVSGGRYFQPLGSTSLMLVALVGPLSFFFVKSCISEDYSLGKVDFLHILPAFLPGLPLAIPEMYPATSSFTASYVSAYLVAGFYTIATGNTYVEKKIWVYSILCALAALTMLITFFSMKMICIISISIGFTVIAYTMSFLFMRWYTRMDGSLTPRPRAFKPMPEDFDDKFQSIWQRVANDKLYLHADLTLSLLADQLQIPPHELSAILNSRTGGFSEFINTFRVNEAIYLLQHTDTKVAAIAFDCGFNSLSSFYASFRKNFDRSPAECRKQSHGQGGAYPKS